MIKLNSPKGLGDAIYLRAIVLHLLACGETITIFTAWPEVFEDLPVGTIGANDYTFEDDIRHAMACLHCRVPAIMTMGRFRLTCVQAQISEPVELQMAWSATNVSLLKDITSKAAGKRILLYQPRKISKDEDQELTRPLRASFNQYVATRDDCFRIKIGNPVFVNDDLDLPCELNLIGKTSIKEVFDIASISDEIFGESSCFLPNLAEAMGRPFVCMFSRRATLAVHRKRAWSMRPEFLIHKKHLATVIYDE